MREELDPVQTGDLVIYLFFLSSDPGAVSYFDSIFKKYLFIGERQKEQTCASWERDRGTESSSRLPAECGP